jgi:hypothetical protein
LEKTAALLLIVGNPTDHLWTWAMRRGWGEGPVSESLPPEGEKVWPMLWLSMGLATPPPFHDWCADVKNSGKASLCVTLLLALLRLSPSIIMGSVANFFRWSRTRK